MMPALDICDALPVPIPIPPLPSNLCALCGPLRETIPLHSETLQEPRNFQTSKLPNFQTSKRRNSETSFASAIGSLA